MSTESYQQLKEKSIELRKEGKTYSEIMAVIPVAKSTISLWLQNVGLAKKQVQRITEKRIEGQKKAARAKRAIRERKQEQIYLEAEKDIEHISKRDLWMIGVALYWAEGNKEKDYHPGSQVIFSNSDVRMIKVFMKWLKVCLNIQKEQIVFEIYLHESLKGSISKVIDYWSEQLKTPVTEFTRIYLKRNKINIDRRYPDILYYGQLRVRVMSSSHILRRIEGWARAISKRVENI